MITAKECYNLSANANITELNKYLTFIEMIAKEGKTHVNVNWNKVSPTLKTELQKLGFTCNLGRRNNGYISWINGWM